MDVKQAESLVIPVMDVSGRTKCAVKNYVSEVLYRVYYRENSDGLYTIADNGIQIEFMLE